MSLPSQNTEEDIKTPDWNYTMSTLSIPDTVPTSLENIHFLKWRVRNVCVMFSISQRSKHCTKIAAADQSVPCYCNTTTNVDTSAQSLKFLAKTYTNGS